jgi:hypothetical protein
MLTFLVTQDIEGAVASEPCAFPIILAPAPRTKNSALSSNVLPQERRSLYPIQALSVFSWKKSKSINKNPYKIFMDCDQSLSNLTQTSKEFWDGRKGEGLESYFSHKKLQRTQPGWFALFFYPVGPSGAMCTARPEGQGALDRCDLLCLPHPFLLSQAFHWLVTIIPLAGDLICLPSHSSWGSEASTTPVPHGPSYHSLFLPFCFPLLWSE